MMETFILGCLKEVFLFQDGVPIGIKEKRKLWESFPNKGGTTWDIEFARDNDYNAGPAPWEDW
jgi:hypothetical protein